MKNKKYEKRIISRQDFPIEFCSFCGSDDICCSGRNNYIFTVKESWWVRCNICKWECEIFITEEGMVEAPVRLDTENCKICAKEYDDKFEDIGIEHFKALKRRD